MPEDIRDKIWITSHVRMKSEQRLRRNAAVLTYLTVWYSTALTCLTVYQLVAEKNGIRDLTSAALAVALLALSLFIPSLKLEHQADRFRECYLELDRLYANRELSDEKIKPLYHDVLAAYPNHLPRDYSEFVVISKFINQEITSSDKKILPTFPMYASFMYRKIGRSLMIMGATFAPALLYFVL